VTVSSERRNDHPADKDLSTLRNVGKYLIIYTAFILVALSLLSYYLGELQILILKNIQPNVNAPLSITSIGATKVK
jgi:hypothetical protein